MRQITRKIVLCAALVVGSLIPLSVQADGDRGHHQSGIIGRVPVEQTIPSIDWKVRVTTDAYETLKVLETDDDGQFAVNLKPGTYRLKAFFPVMLLGEWTELAGPSVPVTVYKKDFTVVELPLTWPQNSPPQ